MNMHSQRPMLSLKSTKKLIKTSNRIEEEDKFQEPEKFDNLSKSYYNPNRKNQNSNDKDNLSRSIVSQPNIQNPSKDNFQKLQRKVFS